MMNIDTQNPSWLKDAVGFGKNFWYIKKVLKGSNRDDKVDRTAENRKAINRSAQQ